MTKSRIFFFLLVAFVGGVALRSFVVIPYFALWFIFIFASLSLVFGILRKWEYTIAGLLGLVLLSGILRYEAKEAASPDLNTYYGNAYEMKGIVKEEPEISGSWQRLKVEINSLDDITAKPFFARVTLRKYPEYFLGDEIIVRGQLQRPERLGDFDYPSYLAKDDIYAQVSFPEVEKIASGRGSPIKQILSLIKLRFESNLGQVLPEPHSAFLKGLILGERESLPEELVENFNRTGTTHIVALSGYNITLVADFFLGTLIFLTLPYRFSFWVATIGIALFVVLTGASPSVVRAGIMGILVLVALREGRVYSVTNALAFAAVLMLFHNPKILRFDAAFQLSFLATLGLIFLSPHTERGLNKIIAKYRPYRLLPEKERAGKDKFKLFPIKRMLAETISAQIMVLPLLIFLFGRVSLVSPLSNILVLLAVPYSMAFGFLAGVMGFVWDPLALLPAGITWILLEYKIRVIELFARFPGAAINFGSWAILLLLPLYGLLFWRIWIRQWKNI